MILSPKISIDATANVARTARKLGLIRRPHYSETPRVVWIPRWIYHLWSTAPSGTRVKMREIYCAYAVEHDLGDALDAYMNTDDAPSLWRVVYEHRRAHGCALSVEGNYDE